MKMRIKEIMEVKQVTNAWLAKEIRISTVSVSNIVTGKSAPSLNNLVKIAHALGVSLDELITKSETEMKFKSYIICPHCNWKIYFESEDDK